LSGKRAMTIECHTSQPLRAGERLSGLSSRARG
jgi:hypothetical protein